MESLIQKIGKEEFESRLEEMFENAQQSLFGGGKELDSFSGIEKLYNHGNQPCLHNAWLFNYTGRPWLTQKWVRKICREFYGTEPLHGYGYGQDEDQGQLGAWFVMAAIGLFDIQGHASARPVFQIASPLFQKITVQLPEERQLVIETSGITPKNDFIRELRFNGRTLNDFRIYRDELMKGGKLSMVLGADPGLAQPATGSGNL